MATSTLEHAMGAALEVLEPMWVEFVFLVCFLIGMLFVRFDKIVAAVSGERKASGAGRKQLSPRGPSPTSQPGRAAEDLHGRLQAEVLAGDLSGAAAAWRIAANSAPTEPAALRLAVQALATTSPDTLVEDIAGHFEAHRAAMGNAMTATVAVEALMGNPELLKQLHAALSERLALRPLSGQLGEALLGGLAAAGDAQSVVAACIDMEASGHSISPRGYALMIKNFLKAGLLDSALTQAKAMRHKGILVPPLATCLLLQAACEAGRAAEVFEAMAPDDVGLPTEALLVVLADCCKRGDAELALRIERSQRSCGSAFLPPQALALLLKIHVAAGNPKAMELWQELVQARRVSEGLAVALLSRSADAKFLRFAEEVARHMRKQGAMTVALYGVLMKVYGACGLQGRACDLYQEMLGEGVPPDAAMYSSLVRFASECGRTDFWRELSQKSPTPDLSNIVSLFKALGRERDAGGVAGLLQKLQAGGVECDLAVFNCALDAFVRAGDLEQAQALFNDIGNTHRPDIVTYNTLLKGVCNRGDWKAAQALLQQMERDGHRPTDVSYNSMINCAVSAGNIRQAWLFVEEMERNGIKPDRFTVAIMLKAVRRDSVSDVQRAFQLLDSSGVDVSSEAVLLNTVLEACVRFRETRRLESILAACEGSIGSLSMHTCAALIRAYSMLQKPEKCWELWRSVVHARALEPNAITLGCMLDALVCAGQVDEAVELFREWKRKFEGATTVMYSTLIKGFANTGRAQEAMAMWREIRAAGVPMNVVVYNTLINAQVRAAAIEEASQVFASMDPAGVPPDAISFATLIKGHSTAGDLDTGFELFHRMRRQGLAKDSVVYNTLLDGCTRHNRMDMADAVVHLMEKDKVAPSSFTLGILVKMHGKRRQLDRAFEVVETFPAKFGVQANAQCMTCLVSACIANGALPRAWGVFEQLRAKGETDSKACGVLLNGCVRAGCAEQALQLVEEAYGLKGHKRLLPYGQHLMPENIEAVARLLAAKGMRRQIRQLLSQLGAARVPLNGRLLNSLLDHADGARGGGVDRPPRPPRQQ